MADVRGVKEKVHLPIYDSLMVEPKKQLRDVETSNILKFFVNLQGKTKLETNASLFSHFNSFEAHGMRGEKIVIQMPTWFFPGGAGPRSNTAGATTHGEPSSTATFRFAEPIVIDKQQNFRVEIEVPHPDFLNEMQRIYGPLFIWVVLDGFMILDQPSRAS